MSNFFVQNGKLINMLSIKENDAIKSDDKFLIKYDKNNNSVWDNDEINRFMEDLNNADENGDGKIDKRESVSWYSKITGTAIDKIQSLFQNDEENEVYESLNSILRQNLEQKAVDRFNQDTKEGLTLYYSALGGAVSKGYNSIKELFGTEYSGDKVYRQLARKQVSSWILRAAQSQNGMTAKEYVTNKVMLLKALLGTDKMSPNEQKAIEDSIKNLDFNKLDTLIQNLTNAENEEYPNLQREVIKELKSNTIPQDSKKARFNSVGSFLNSKQAEEKMSFDKIYELETGVPFSEKAIQEYEDTLQSSQIVVMVNNRISELIDKLKTLSATPAPYEPSHLNEVMDLLPQIFDSQEEIESFLGEFGIKVTGKNLITTYDYGIPNYPTNGGSTSADVAAEAQAQQKAQMMAQALINRLNEKVKNFMNGKSIEDYQKEVKQAYTKAYGDKNSVDLASKFQQSQQDGVGYVKIGVGVVGAGICLLSDGTMLPVVQGMIVGTGMAVATLGGAGVSYLEAKTKDGGMTEQDKAEIISELKTSGVLSILSFGEGAAAAKIGERLLSCGKFLSFIGEYGSMAAMGALTDYAVMGDINLSQEAISNLINIATGMIAHKKVANMQKRMQSEANGQNKVHENSNNAKPKFGLEEESTPKAKEGRVLEGGIKDTELTEVAHEAKHLAGPDERVANPQIKAGDNPYVREGSTIGDIELYVKDLYAKQNIEIGKTEAEKIAKKLYQIKEKNISLYKDIVETGMLNLIEEGKISPKMLESISDFGENSRLSQNMIQDCRLLAKGEEYIQSFKSGTAMSDMLSATSLGEVVESGSKLYINDGETMIELGMSKEKYMELFPPVKRFDINQNTNKHAGNCWFLETAFNLYQNPKTRVEILKNFRQEGNDIIVKLPNSNIEYKFADGKIPGDGLGVRRMLSDSPAWMNMLEFAGAMERSVNGDISQGAKLISSPNIIESNKASGIITETSPNHFCVDMQKYMNNYAENSNPMNSIYNAGRTEGHFLRNLYAGRHDEAVEMLTGNKNTKIMDLTESVDQTKAEKTELKAKRNSLMQQLKDVEGKTNVSINVGIGPHAYAVSRIEDGKIYLVDPYKTSEEMVYTIKEFVNICRFCTITQF